MAKKRVTKKPKRAQVKQQPKEHHHHAVESARAEKRKSIDFSQFVFKFGSDFFYFLSAVYVISIFAYLFPPNANSALANAASFLTRFVEFFTNAFILSFSSSDGPAGIIGTLTARHIAYLAFLIIFLLIGVDFAKKKQWAIIATVFLSIVSLFTGALYIIYHLSVAPFYTLYIEIIVLAAFAYIVSSILTNEEITKILNQSK